MHKAYSEILSLMNEYCFRVDTADFNGFAELFENASFGVIGDPKGPSKGKSEVLEYLDRVILYDGKPMTKHTMTNVQIDIDEASKKAKAQSYLTVMQAVPPDFPLQPIFSGHYHDTFEQVDGIWRFTIREISPDLIGDLSFHLRETL